MTLSISELWISYLYADVRIRGRVRTNLLKNYITLWALYFRKVVESRYVWWCDVWFFMAAL